MSIFLPCVPGFRIVRNFLFGTGADGTHTLDGVSTVPPGLTYLGTNRYRCDRHVHFANLQINTNISLIPNGYAVFVSGTLTFQTNGTITGSGTSTGLYSPGVVQGVANWFSGGQAGVGDANIGRNGIAGTDASNCLGGSGGNSGPAGIYTGALGGVATAPSFTPTRAHLIQIVEAILDAGTHPWGFAAGRNGAAGASSTGEGGGGGAGGGEIAVFARAIAGDGNGSIKADGSIAGFYSRSAGFGTFGGGGGAGGGIVWFATADASYATKISVHANGGALGLGNAGPNDGTAGGNGIVIAAII